MLVRIAALIAFLFSATSYASNHESALTGLQGATVAIIEAVTEDREKLDADRELLYSTVRGIVDPHFDFQRMSRLALGKWWRKASDGEKVEFERLFSDLIVRTYSTAVLNYTDQDIKWKLGNADPKGKVKVSVVIVDSNGVPIDVVFFLAKSKRYHGFRVYDVHIEGISIVLTYRSSFNEVARNRKVSGVIRSLQEKSDSASK